MKVNKKLFDTVDALLPQYIQYWYDFASIESPTSYKKGVDDAVNYICSIASSHGWKIEKAAMEISGDPVCITMNPDSNNPPIALSGHVDTVHPLGLFGYPPVKIEGDSIYGPGVNDCKGGVIAALMAMDVLEKNGYTDRPVKLILQTDEETGSSGSKKATVRFMAEKARDAAAFINLEGYNIGKATLRRKGITSYNFHVVGKSVHSANCYNGVNAIAEAALKILELEKYKDRAGITINCGVISGGSTTNTVPAECTFAIDTRFSNKEEMNKIDEIVKEVAGRSFIEGSTCEVTMRSRRVSMDYVERNVELFKKMNGIYEEYGLPVLAENGSSGGSDAADITEYGIPCIDSLGTHGWDIHSARERSDIPSLPESAKRLCAVIWSF